MENIIKSFKFFNKNSSNKRKGKKIYRFKYETSQMYTHFYGYINPSQNFSIVSTKRLIEHGFDINRFPFGKITSSAHLNRNNKFENIVGVCELKIFLENTANGLKNTGVGGGVDGAGITSPLLKNNKVEKKVHSVLVLNEAKVEFRLGNDFISDCNAVIEPKRIKNHKFTHQLRFVDGVTVDLEQIENIYDVYEEDEENSDEENYEIDDYIDENHVGLRRNSKHSLYSRFKFFLMKLNIRIGLSNIIIIFLILLIMILYTSTMPQSLVKELVISPYNTQFTRPGLDNKLEDYARKLKITTSFFELFELNKRQNPKSSSSQQSKGEEETRGQELYTNLVKYTESFDNTKRTLMDMYIQEVSYFSLFQQNIENLLDYLTLKKKANIFQMIPFIGGYEYFPLTKNLDGLINDVEKVIVNNTILVIDEIVTIQNYCDEIIIQVGRMKIDLESFIEGSNIPFTSWLNALFKERVANIDNLGEIGYDTALKFKKLLTALDNNLSELSNLFVYLNFDLKNHLYDLSAFSEHFKFINRITDLEVEKIKKYLVKLQKNRRIIFATSVNGCRIREDDIIECSD
ncbi:hypothetical protein C1645_879425 [Glomus cerebriforme]|uniref:Uncharacterized protein n=1 Tax=Glomus cerebriforme TaxID=658196 RepID=A0A397SG68_9GLOM|nr:hypothetical protein C1645_879425 [Glomus cerebriforme]